ncbi:MAG: DNA polymerase III [Treponema sp.]|jgi:DNA polymerase-3 subunit gamma/tau|nr:DNA polymerase III [Treponema sp.]
MFENLLGQEAGGALAADIAGGALPRALLFQGPAASGKGTAALELARVLSCGQRGAWNCACPSCERHRALTHGDLCLMGARPFSAELAASESAFLRESSSAAAKTLFIRALRKLLGRFNPILWEGHRDCAKLSGAAAALEEGLAVFTAAPLDDLEALSKLTGGLREAALKLETDGIPGLIPIDQIRKVNWWSRLAPTGKAKVIIIENAERMLDPAKNSLLKLLEEPPAHTTIVLTSARPRALLQTVLSRLRPYRFAARPPEVEREVLRRIFKTGEVKGDGAGAGGSLIAGYLNSFLPVSEETLAALAGFFAASVAAGAGRLLVRQGGGVPPAPPPLALLGAIPRGGGNVPEGLREPKADCKAACDAVLAAAEDFSIPSLFSRFCAALRGRVLAALGEEAASPLGLHCIAIWKKESAHADAAVSLYNQKSLAALERLFTVTASELAAACAREAAA